MNGNVIGREQIMFRLRDIQTLKHKSRFYIESNIFFFFKKSYNGFNKSMSVKKVSTTKIKGVNKILVTE